MPYIVLTNDELAHFKYIKKTPNGHGGWRYYYDKFEAASGIGRTPSQMKQTQLDSAFAYKTALNNAARGVVTYDPKDENAFKRQMAAHLQEFNRIEAYEREQKKPINVAKNIAKSAVNSISTAVGSSFDKGKNWLSGILTTKTTVTPAKPIQSKTGGIFSTKKTIKIL